MRVLSTLISFAIVKTVSAALLEPPDGQVYLGAWLATNDSTPGANDGDRPNKFNERMGWKAGVFQYAQNMPIGPGEFPFPEEQIYETNTHALILLTVYARPNPWEITDADVDFLANQMRRVTVDSKRQVIIRFSPEMNGDWIYYGQQPVRYIELWKRVFNAVKAKAPNVAFLWSPSTAGGYPYSLQLTTEADRPFLDTNKDGVIDANDDAFSPYYPGDEFVDWVGMSVYTYGSRYPWSDNIIAPEGKFEASINHANFYQLYAIEKNKPISISETGASFHVNTPLGPGVGELATKQSWWQQYITKKDFWERYPKIKLLCLFEFAKFEEKFANGEDSFRDFRISMNPEVREAFNRDLESVKSHYILGDSEYLKNEAIKNGVRFEGGSNPGGSSGSVPSPSQIAQIGFSAIFGALFAYLVRSYI